MPPRKKSSSSSTRRSRTTKVAAGPEPKPAARGKQEADRDSASATTSSGRRPAPAKTKPPANTQSAAAVHAQDAPKERDRQQVELAPHQFEQAVRERAYYIYLERNGVAGDPADDWARAEREIRAHFRA